MWAVLLPPTFWLFLYYAHIRSRSRSTISTRHASSHFSMSWYGTATYATSSLNQLLYRTAQRHRRLLHYFYLPSIPIALLTLPLSVALLLFNVLHIAYVHVLLPLLAPLSSPAAAAASASSLSSTNLLSIAVPGFTLPLSSIGYLWSGVLCGVVLHEAGHALCACVEGVRLRSVGLMWLVMFPAAYVETEELDDGDDGEPNTDSGSEYEGEEDNEDGGADRAPAITAVQQLKIVSAGVYHNLLLSAASLALLVALPTLFSLAYHTTDSGLTILNVDGGVSPALASSSVLTTGSRVVGVNQWTVSDVSEWQNVLVHHVQQPAATRDGWCVSTAMVEDTAKVQRRQTSKWTEAKGDGSWPQLAQHVSIALQTERAAPQPPSSPLPTVDEAPSVIPLPTALRHVGGIMDHSDRPLVPANNVEYDSDMLAFACCQPELAHLSSLVCFAHNLSTSSTSASLCLQPKGLISASTPTCSVSTPCSPSPIEPMTCVSAQLPGNQKLLVLVIETADGGTRSELRFVGRVEEVLGAVEGTSYAMRGWLRFVLIFAPFLWSLAVRWPILCNRALQFVVAVSTSLLVLNALPIPYADGQQFVQLLGVVARDKRRPADWYHRLLQRVLHMFPLWWWLEQQVEWRVRVVTALFIVNVALGLLPILASLAAIGFSYR